MTGGFGAHPDHDAHLLSTLSAIQILITQNALDRLDVERVVKCMLFQPCSRAVIKLCSHTVIAATVWCLRWGLIWRDRYTISLLRR